MSAREALEHPWLQNERPPTLRLTRSFRQRQVLLQGSVAGATADEKEGAVAANVVSRSVSEEDLKMSSMSINERLGVFRQCDYSSADRWKKFGGKAEAVNRMLERGGSGDLRGVHRGRQEDEAEVESDAAT